MDPVTSVIVKGLITSACYDLIKKSFNKVIKPTFSKIYYETIDELSHKYENIDRLSFNVFFGDERISEEVNKFKERHEVDLEIITDEFKRFFDEEEINVDPEIVLNDFFRILELKMEKVPELKEKLKMQYLRDLKSGQREIMERQDKAIDLITDFKIEELIEKNKDDLFSLVGVLKKIQKPLNTDPLYAIKWGGNESGVFVSYRPRSQEALEKDPLHWSFKIKPKEKNGRIITFKDVFKEMQKTRTPITFDEDHLIDSSMFKGDKPIIPVDFTWKWNLTITPEPFPKPRPVKIFIPDTNVGFDYVLLGVIESDGTKIKLSSTDKNLPYKFEFSLDLETKEKEQFNFKANYQNANVSQAFNWVRFLRKLEQKKEIAVKDLETDKIFFSAVIDDLSIELEDDAYYEPLKDLSYIQEKTMKQIPCPTKLINKDIWDIKEIREIIENGRIERHFSEIGFKIKKQGLKRFLKDFKDHKIVSSIKCNITDVEGMIFGVKIPLGSCTSKLPPVELLKSVDKIEKDAENLLDEDFIKISLRPVSNKPCIMVFDKWS
ncbi:MAG: hypothetical protein OCU12_06410 [Methanophagales archaeon]|nr:hypothetical protein [Methanophagales archaeon]